MVLIFTDFANASSQVIREVNYAVSAGLFIVPFKLSESFPAKGMEYYLSVVHWLDAVDVPLEKGIEKLKKLVAAALNDEEADFEYESKPARKKPVIPIIAAALALVVGAGCAVLDEFRQRLALGRYASLADVLTDVFGVALGCAIVSGLLALFPRRS